MNTKKIIITAMVFITALVVLGLYDVRLCATAYDNSEFLSTRHLIRTFTSAGLVAVLVNALFSTRKREA